jgi:hypothetical protein
MKEGKKGQERRKKERKLKRKIKKKIERIKERKKKKGMLVLSMHTTVKGEDNDE